MIIFESMRKILKPSISLLVYAGFAVAIFMVTGAVFGQGAKDFKGVKLINVPTPTFPKEATESGLGGKITVRVSIDDKGKVKSVDDAEGPDWVCSAIHTPDVVALRNAAKDAAVKATFSPATEDGKPVKSVSLLKFTFPTPPPVNKPNGPKISGAVTNGKLLHAEKPIYPKEVQKLGVGGAVSVKLLILEDGSIYSAEPISGDKLLHSSARVAACGSEYSPTLLADHPVKVGAILTYNFVP